MVYRLLGAAPAPEFTFLIFCSPVGAYMSKDNITEYAMITIICRDTMY